MRNTFADPNLDILRAIAVLTVLATHLLEVLSGYHVGDRSAAGINNLNLGHAGVLIFFVHTALVLMQSMERLKLSGWALLRSFYIRRAFRIYPLSIALVLICVACSIPPNAVGDPYVPARPAWVVVNCLLVQNLFRGASVSSPLWSLPYEVQMYLVLPLVVFLAVRRPAGLLWCGLLYGAIWSGAGLSYLPAVCQYAPCFFAGILAYRLLSIPALRFHLHWSGWCILILVSIAIYTGSGVRQAGIAKNGLMCLIIGCGVPVFARAGGPIAAVASRVAKYSYGIYLCHTPLLWLFFRKLALPHWAALVCVLAGMAAVAVASYHLLEAPLVRVGARLAASATDPKKTSLVARGGVQPAAPQTT